MKSNKSGKSNSKKNKNESTSPIKRATFVEPSQPQMALKISVSSSAVLKRQHSNTDTDGDEKINSDDSALRLEKSCSKEQTKSPEPDLSRSSESKEELKSERNVNSSSRTFSSVIEVKPGAPPPLRIGPEVQLHLRQPFKILTDIWGVLISYDFRKTIFQFTDDHLKQYIIEHFEESETVDYVNKLAAKTAEDLAGGSWPTMPTVPTVPEDGKLNDNSLSKEAVAEAVLRNLAFRKETKDKSMLANLETIYSQVWNDGYEYERSELFEISFLLTSVLSIQVPLKNTASTRLRRRAAQSAEVDRRAAVRQGVHLRHRPTRRAEALSERQHRGRHRQVHHLLLRHSPHLQVRQWPLSPGSVWPGGARSKEPLLLH